MQVIRAENIGDVPPGELQLSVKESGECSGAEA